MGTSCQLGRGEAQVVSTFVVEHYHSLNFVLVTSVDDSCVNVSVQSLPCMNLQVKLEANAFN